MSAGVVRSGRRFACAVTVAAAGYVAAVGCERYSNARVESGDGERTARSSPKPAAGGWLVDVTDESGIDFIHETGASGKLYSPEVMMSGVASFDYDNDGDLDLYFVNGHEAFPEWTSLTGVSNRLYRNDGDWKFVDVTRESRLGDTGYGMGVAVGDVNNDGFEDVYVSNLGPDRLYLNSGDGTFRPP